MYFTFTWLLLAAVVILCVVFFVLLWLIRRTSWHEKDSWTPPPPPRPRPLRAHHPPIYSISAGHDDDAEAVFEADDPRLHRTATVRSNWREAVTDYRI